MNHSIAKLSVAALGVVAVAAIAAPVHETIHGRVRAAGNGSVHVCFYDDYAPAAGAEFVLLRNVVIAAHKSQSPIRHVDVGAIRVSGGGEQGCANAQVLRGEAKTGDWVAVLVNDSR